MFYVLQIKVWVVSTHVAYSDIWLLNPELITANGGNLMGTLTLVCLQNRIVKY